MTPRRPEDAPDEAEDALQEALERARRHAKNAVSESLAALGALLDAASLASTGVSARVHPLFAGSARRVDAWSRALAEEGRIGGELGAALADALDAEIARWEERAREDGEARAVLRAFLGLRELLWELGVRRPPRGGDGAPGGAEPPPDGGPDAGGPDATPGPRRRRVERVPVQG